MKSRKLLKLTVLSVSFLTIMGSAVISPALGKISQHFSGVNPTTIRLILTLPQLIVIPVSLLSGRLALVVKTRLLLMIGLALYLIGGISGGLANNITFLLVSRAIFGVGIGIIMPLSQGLIASFFAGEERSEMMGFSSAVSNLGAIVMVLMAGSLAAINWRLAFLAYLVVVAVMILTGIYLPEPDSGHEKQGGKVKLPAGVYGIALLSSLLMVVFYTIPVNMAIFLQQEGLGGPAISGLITSILTFASFVVGVAFAVITRTLKHYTVAISLLVMGIGFIALSAAFNLAAVLGAVFAIGAGLGIIYPILMITTSRMVPARGASMALSVVSSALFFGQFSSPLIFNLLSGLNPSGGIRFAFQISGVALIISTAFSLISLIHWNRFKPAKELS